MKRLIVVVVAIFIAVTLLLLVFGRVPEGGREGDAGGDVGPSTTQTGMAAGEASAIAAGSAALHVPWPVSETIFRRPVSVRCPTVRTAVRDRRPFDYSASWKMMPSVCREPARTRLTPWRRFTRYVPRAPRTGR